MAVTQELSLRYVASAHLLADLEEMAQRGIYAIFRAREVAMSHTILESIDRKDRIILLLLNGERTLHDIAQLTHRTELDIAYTLVYLLRRGYVEFLNSSTSNTALIIRGMEKS
ncbi:MAG TPA: hypothetical protein VL461_02030 [Dictyobacter sp.]|nr:hypothetical protein [Dictyobacter sp.]